MARYRDANCKLCRREGEKLFLKGARCFTDKCAIEKRQYVPGQHGKDSRRKISAYGLQLREKQKIRRTYGVLERQFHNYFEKAEQRTGITGENLVRFLECRLDNIVYRLGFAPSRKAARQLVRHRHILVDGETCDIPSYQVAPRQIIRVRDKSRKLDAIHSALKLGHGEEFPWLRLNKAALEGELLALPQRSEIPLTANEQLVVELYSK